MGMNVNATAGNTVAGEDNAKARADGLFTLLTLLRDGLAHDDSRGITFAGAGLDRGVSNLARVRADTGIRPQRVQQEQERSRQMGITEQKRPSKIRDTDFAQAVTRFTQ